MKYIKKYVDRIDEELCGAKDYAEEYVMWRAKGNSTLASQYKEMCFDELKHANYIHDEAIAAISELNNVFVAPQEMQDLWDKSHKEYVEKEAWIKQMLQM